MAINLQLPCNLVNTYLAACMWCACVVVWTPANSRSDLDITTCNHWLDA